MPAKNEQKSEITDMLGLKENKKNTGEVRRREKVRQKVGEEEDEERMQVAEECQQ